MRKRLGVGILVSVLCSAATLGLGLSTRAEAGQYANVVVVAKSGGDFSDPISAINSISDATASKPYLIKIMPGIYDIQDSSISLKNYIDIEGSGVNTTKIIGNGSIIYGLYGENTVSELRDFTIESRGIASNMTVVGGAPNKMTNIDINAKSTTNLLRTQFIGISTPWVGGSTTPTILTNVKVNMDANNISKCVGIWLANGRSDIFIKNSNFTCSNILGNGAAMSQDAWGYSLKITNSDFNASGENAIGMTVSDNNINNSYPPMTMLNSSVSGTSAAIKANTYQHYNNTGELDIINSKIVGSIQNSSFISFKCLNNYNQNLEPVACP